ncbi:MAG: hypothetical protein DRH24_06540, partial [Deltaproteobacteria bacterium]
MIFEKRHKPHYLKENKSCWHPKHWFFFDIETEPIDINQKTQTHTFRLCCAELCYFNLDKREKGIQPLLFKGPFKIAEFLDKTTKKYSPLFCASLNLSYDILTSHLFFFLTELGWKTEKFWCGDRRVIVQFKKKKRVLWFLDISNWLRGSVKQIGKLVGLEKLSVDFNNVSEKELIKYCRRDVEIIREGMWFWLNFIKENDLGRFAFTLAGQAFNALRHRFMTEEIVIHDNEEAAELELEAYFGGRCECFGLGRFRDKELFYLDVNSMYPYVMKEFEYPIRLYKVEHNPSINKLKFHVNKHCVIAHVLIYTEKPMFPLRLENKVIYPTGYFWTTLTTPRLKLALKYAKIIKIEK